MDAPEDKSDVKSSSLTSLAYGGQEGGHLKNDHARLEGSSWLNSANCTIRLFRC